MLEKKWEYNEAVHKLFIDFKKAYDSVRREVFYLFIYLFIHSFIHFVTLATWDTSITVRNLESTI
jgi:hypothetical protein